MINPLHTQVLAQVLQATQSNALLNKGTHPRVFLYSSLIQLIPTTLLDQWALEVHIQAQDNLLIKDTLGSHSMAGRVDPLLGLCMENLPKTRCTWWKTGGGIIQRTRA